jgi:hypothetical protein
MKKIVKIEYDDYSECPMDMWDGQWTLVPFNKNSIHFQHPDNFFPLSIGLRRKLKVGLAFLLDYYEHGLGAYSLAGEGMQCQWDTARCAGLLLWQHLPKEMGAKTYEARAKDARSFLETYNNWMNGHVLWYSIEDEKGELIDSCGGFYKPDYFSERVAEYLEAGDLVVITGEADGWLRKEKLPEGITVFDSLDELKEYEQELLNEIIT